MSRIQTICFWFAWGLVMFTCILALYNLTVQRTYKAPAFGIGHYLDIEPDTDECKQEDINFTPLFEDNGKYKL